MISNEDAVRLLRETAVVTDSDTARIWRAMMLAPRLDVCQALLRGESVPIEKLDPEWVRRFGRRKL